MLLIALLIPLGMAIFVYAFVLARAAITRRAKPTLEALVLGAVVNFFDTFGIGSFAQTTAWMKFRRMVPDRLIPPTMIAGLTPPAMVESIIFLILLGVRVDPVLLFGGAIATLHRRRGRRAPRRSSARLGRPDDGRHRLGAGGSRIRPCHRRQAAGRRHRLRLADRT